MNIGAGAPPGFSSCCIVRIPSSPAGSGGGFSTPFIFIYLYISLKRFFQNKFSGGIVMGVEMLDNFSGDLLHL